MSRVQTRSKKPTYMSVLGVESLVQPKENAQPQLKAPAPAQAQTAATSKIERSASQRNQPTHEDDILMTEEEMEEILLDEDQKSLLALRQQYKKTRTNITRVNSHLTFIDQCIREDKVPKGLRINVRCNALLSDYTNVKDQFKSTKEMAEFEFSEALKNHYKKVKTKLEENLKTLEATMTKELEKAEDNEKKEHLELMKKTEENIEKHEERLRTRKTQKMEHLTNPETGRQRTFQRRQDQTRGRGMPYQAKNYNPKPKRQSNYKRPPINNAWNKQVALPPVQSSIVPPAQPNIGPPAQPSIGPPAQPSIVPPTQPPMTNVMQEVAEMKSILNQLLLTRPQPPIQQPPQLHFNNQHCTPLGQQHPSLLGPGGSVLPGQHPSLVRQNQQYFQPRDRLPTQQPTRNI